MKVKTGFILCCFVLMTAGLKGKEPLKKKDAQTLSLKTQLDNQVTELMADRVGLRTDMSGGELAVIDYFLQENLLASEALLFPADELYGGEWDSCWVNPFRSKNITIPDSCQIDCSAFVLPIDNELQVTSKYGPRGRRMHRGIDLNVYVGDTIRAAFDGKVRIKSFERRGYGNYLVIRHPNGLETIYGHLSKHLVSENEIVRAGQPIALGGNTGRSSGSHLHFETRFLGQAIDPSAIIDFENGVPLRDYYVFHKEKNKPGNIYISTSERIVYHRVRQGETLSIIARRYRTTVSELCRLNGIKSNSPLRIGQSIRCGTAKVKAAPQKAVNAVGEKTSDRSVPQQATAVYHKVQPNETLISIARQYGTTVESLCRLNHIQATNALREGQELCCREVKTTAPKKDVKQQEDNVASMTDERIVPASKNEEMEVTALNTNAVYYQVRSGDTLHSIAQKHGLSIIQLCELNYITKTTILKVGRSLRCS
jgi:murein DD-endopeptidase MepM/ murein hydrolase activator NlpD